MGHDRPGETGALLFEGLDYYCQEFTLVLSGKDGINFRLMHFQRNDSGVYNVNDDGISQESYW